MSLPLTLLRRPMLCLSVLFIVLVVIAALFAPWCAPFDPAEQFAEGLSLEGAPLPPGGTFWLGTDLLGRDLLSRLIFGARTSLLVGVLANGMAVAIGVLVGLIAGYLQGPLGSLLMRFTDLMMAFPALLLAIALAAIFQPSVWIVALVIAMVNWVQIARVIYAETSALSARDFVAVERTLGAGSWRILTVHLIPHLVPTILVWATLGISTTVLLEATLSFLGVGVQPPMASWGNIIFESQTWFTSAPWLVFFPGAAIVLLSLAFNIVGDTLRDALDPTLKRGE
ncbi:ABC transporter permease [Affinibrenneria salicis]|uniref:ABC transporter permease n=1 Tax=Affinibrenneria salicis TaxID=2590031 RepID=UPI0037C0BD80